MHSATRLSRSFYDTATRNHVSQYVCKSCKRSLLLRPALRTPRPRYISSTASPTTTEREPPNEKRGVRRWFGRSTEEKEAQAEQEVLAEIRQMEREEARMNASEPDPEAAIEYKPAQTWDGLEHVGHKGDWRDIPPTELDAYTPFTGHVQNKASTRAELLSCLHQAIVEVSALGDSVFALGPQTQTHSYVDSIFSCPLTSSPDGSISVKYPSDEARQIVSERKKAAESELTDTVSENQFYQVPSTDFLSHSLQNLTPLHFQILKRFTQLSGRHVPDPILNSRKDLGHFIEQMELSIQKPKAAKLASKLLQDEKLAAIPNLHVNSRRETMVDKEKSVGRWKVIEEVLRSRGLPTVDAERYRDKERERALG